ncbi:hypothetical protein GYA19_00020, partial [Candidatus Beckwithbacteria bacterium]|nr:hypothetical protein [Candidatus Beckwithbacteria bacterium]
GIYIFIKNKSWKILYSLPLFILGFYTYHAYKILFLPLIFILLLCRYFSKKSENKQESLKPYLLYFLVSIIFIFSFFLNFDHQAASTRKGQFLLFTDNQIITKTIDKQRSLSLPSPLNKIFYNKLTYLTNIFIEQYLGFFSADSIFKFSEDSTVAAISYWGEHGNFYLIEFFLLIFCFIGFLNDKNKRNKISLIFLIALLAVSIIPTALSDGKQYVFRSGLAFPILIMLIAYGIYHFINLFQDKYKKVIIGVITVLYLLSILNYYNIYFYRYPVFAAEGFMFSQRLLSSYLSRIENDQNINKIIVINAEPSSIFEQYLFYSNIYNSKQIAQQVIQNYKDNNFAIDKIQFTNQCIYPNYLDNKTVLMKSVNVDCQDIDYGKHANKANKILDLKDSRTIFYIYNDNLCDPNKLLTYYRILSQSDFKIEQLNNEEFCQKWIAK